MLLALALQIQAQVETKNFRGSIGDKRIYMSLKRDGRNLSGTYQYQKIGRDLRLSGTIDAEGSFRLEELDPKGAKTGEFTGKWSEDTGAVTLSGEWKAPKSSETWAFYLDQQIIEFTGGAKLGSKPFSEANKPKMFDITAEYPELSGVNPAVGAKFNQLVKTRVMDRVTNFRKDMMSQTAEDLKFARERGVGNFLDVNYGVELANDEIISISFSNSIFEGGAHPNHFTFPVNFDLKTGKELKLADLFKPGANYLKTISDYSITQLKEKTGDMSDEEWIRTGAGPEAQNFDSWNVTKKGILIIFDPYQVAAYAAGPHEVLIPYDELKNILREGSVVSGLINK